MVAAALAGTLLFGCKTRQPAAPAVESHVQAVTTCSGFTVTNNTYNGSQWWGTITIRNNGPSSVSSFKVEFDVPAGKHCTAEPESVPAGATLTPLTGSNPAHTTSNHCIFTWTNTTIGVGASKTFNYSTDTQSMSSASSVAVTDLSCAGPTCAMGITQNTYNGSQWWGTITFKNLGTTTASSYSVEFDVPSGKHCTAEPESVPAGAELTPLTGSNPPHTVSNHCIFTWAKGTALAPGASKTFNYSTDTQSMSSASGVVAMDTACGASSGPAKGTGANFPPSSEPPKANPSVPTAEEVVMQHGSGAMPPPQTIPGQPGGSPKAENDPPTIANFYGRARFQFQAGTIVPDDAVRVLSSELLVSDTVDGPILVVARKNGTALQVVAMRDPRVAYGVATEDDGHSEVPVDTGYLTLDVQQTFIASQTELQNSTFQFFQLSDDLPNSTKVELANLSTLLNGATPLGEVPGSALVNLFFPVIP